ncbi:head-tail connector protein [Cupriavidus sp. RAF12]|uniref:head-tail connector protein n=1 Tax=Cupriavidus sp. RAF12 TaxID=3233050 RepID=UPI003F916085
MYRVIAPVDAEPVTLAEAKGHIKVVDAAEDADIAAMIATAREFAEHYTGRALASQTLEMALDEFPGSRGCIDLDMPPVASVTSIKYTDAAGVEQTVPANAYSLSLYGASRRVSPAYSVCWPITQCIADAVRIRYVTGYQALPKAARSAILLLVGHLYENRQTVSAMKLEEIPLGARSLLDTIKIWGK